MNWWQVVGEYLAALIGTAGQALTLNPDAAQRADGFGWSVPVGTAVVAGVSIMVGQSLVLAINRVGRRRGVLTLVASGLGMVVVGLVEALMVWLVARIVLDAAPQVGELLPGVLIALAPYWLGFLVLLPYTGPGVARGLRVWHLLALWTLLTPVLATDRGPALLVAAVAWLAAVAVDHIAERSPLRLRHRLFMLVSGSKGFTARDLLASAPMRGEK